MDVEEKKTGPWVGPYTCLNYNILAAAPVASRGSGRLKSSLKPYKDLNLYMKLPKTILWPMPTFPNMENSIGLVGMEISSFRQKIPNTLYTLVELDL